MGLPQLMVAPNGARRTKQDHPALPVTVAEIVEVAKRCFEAGADGLHAHVRDVDQKHILDAGLYRELIGEMKRQVPGMQVQITTEAVGVYTPHQQRKLVREVRPEAVSIAYKELSADGETDTNCDFYGWAESEGIAVQHILYSAEEVRSLLRDVEAGRIASKALLLLFVLGRYTQNQQSDVSDLDAFLDALEEFDSVAEWSVCAFGHQETQCLIAAHRRGGKMRVGFENSLHNSDGTVAADNVERVREICRLMAK